MQDFDPLHVIERASRAAGGSTSWWSRLAESLAPQLDRGGGMYAYRMPLATMRPTDFVNLGVPQVMIDYTRAGAEQAENRAALRAVDPSGLYASSEVFSLEGLVPGVADALALSIVDGEGSMYVLLSVSGKVERVPEEDRLLWKRLTLHLGAGLRLQRQAGTLDDPEVEAVLEPDGTLVHAESTAVDAEQREQLRDAARRLDRMRGRRDRAGAQEALELWQGLLLGRWSMVDHFDTDGRRFLVARRNDPDAPAPRQLSRRQRQVVFYAALGLAHKQIGYALGIAETTVANHLREALDKLGIQSRAELINVVAHLMRTERSDPSPRGA